MTSGEFQVSLTPSTTEYSIQPAPRSSWKQDEQEPSQGLSSSCSHPPDHILPREPPHSLPHHAVITPLKMFPGKQQPGAACQEQKLP